MKANSRISFIVLPGAAASARPKRRAALATGLSLAFLASAGAAPLQLNTNVQQTDAPAINRSQHSETGGSLSDSMSSPWDTGSVTASYGSVTTALKTGVPALPYSWFVYTGLTGNFTTEMTIDSPGLTGQLGTARIVFHLDGDLSVSSSGGAGVQNNYSVFAETNFSNLVNQNGTISNTGTTGTPYQSLRTITTNAAFYYGTPLQVKAQLSTGTYTANVDVHGGSSTSGNLSLSMGSFTVLDGQNNPVNYTATALSGSARGMNFAPSQSFNTFSLTNTAPNRVGSTLTLLGGTASATENVNAAFVPPPAAAQIKLASDAVDLTGTGSDPFVIQLNYDSGLLQSLSATSTGEIGWFDSVSGTWKNAVLGNTGTSVPTFFTRAYNPATDFHPGYFGIDKANKVVWAVVNHNSRFGVMPSPLAVTSISRTAPNTIHLNCTGERGAMNRIEASTTLGANSFTTIATIAVDETGSFQYEEPISGPKKFFRIAYP